MRTYIRKSKKKKDPDGTPDRILPRTKRIKIKKALKDDFDVNLDDDEASVDDLSPDEPKEPRKVIKRRLKTKSKRNRGNGLGSGKKVRKRYKKQQCMNIDYRGVRCNMFAVGKSTLCSHHGGSRIVKDNLVTVDEYPVTNVKFNAAVHPIQFIQYSREGLSDIEVAARFEVGVETLRNWADTFEEFSVAYEIGLTMYEAWFLSKGTDNLNNTRFNTPLYKFITGNRLGYSDKIESKNFNSNVNHGVLLVPDKMSLEEWEITNAAQDKIKKDKSVQQEETIDADYKEI